MNSQQLLTAHVLDIIFEGRNKEYGAYLLRKEYSARLRKAMLTTGAITAAIIILFSSKPAQESGGFTIPETATITLIDIPAAKPEMIIPPKPAAPPPSVKTIQFASPPKIVVDSDVKPDEKPPENSSLDKVKIDVFTHDGPESVYGAPPQRSTDGVIGDIAAGRREEDKVFEKVEIESTYPGGPQAWARFLNKTFVYPQAAAGNGIQGIVVIKFIVDQSGNVSNIEAIDGPDELQGEAIRVIRKSGKWNPAIQNGRRVKSYKQQAISFKLLDQ